MSHYDTLEVSESASLEAIRGAYKYLSQKWHPDKNSEAHSKAEARMSALNEAYRVLSNPILRSQYDAELRIEREEGEERRPNGASESKGGTRAEGSYANADTRKGKDSSKGTGRSFTHSDGDSRLPLNKRSIQWITAVITVLLVAGSGAWRIHSAEQRVIEVERLCSGASPDDKTPKGLLVLLDDGTRISNVPFEMSRKEFSERLRRNGYYVPPAWRDDHGHIPFSYLICSPAAASKVTAAQVQIMLEDAEFEFMSTREWWAKVVVISIASVIAAAGVSFNRFRKNRRKP